MPPSAQPRQRASQLGYRFPFGDFGGAASWLATGSLLILVFLVDLWSPVGLAVPACYVVSLLLIVSVPGTRPKIAIASMCTGLIIVHYFLSPSASHTPSWAAAVNYGSTLTMIWIVTILALRHKRVEQDLRQSEERFRALVEASAQIVWTTDADGNVIEDSPSWRAFTGQSYEQWQGSGWLNAYHPDDRKRIQTNWQRAVTEKTPLEAQYRLRRHDGQWRWVWVGAVPLLAADGSVSGWVGMNMDITERQQAEADTLFLLDLGECIRLASDPDELTWAVAVAVGEHLQVERCGFIEIEIENDRVTVHRDYHPHAPSVVGTYPLCAFNPAVIRTGKAGHNTVICDTALDPRTAECVEAYRQLGVGAFAAVPLLRNGRMVAGLIIAAREPRDWSERESSLITTVAERTWLAVEKLRLDRALRQSEEALREGDRHKDEFLATLAHELRNPLSLIRNVVNLIQIPGSSEDELRWGRDIIDRQVNYLTRLTDDLFDVSRITRQQLDLKKERFELSEVVEAAVESSRPFIDGRGHKLSVTLSPEPIYVEGDRIRLAQVFMNLLSNAAKYTPQAGRIWLNVEAEGDSAVIRVIDTGLGIAPENLPHVFDLFYQVDRSFIRAEGGLGLGLTLVRRLIDLHGGTIEAHSAGANRGTEFIVRLPLLSDRRGAQLTHGRQGNDPHMTTVARRILVADDFPESANTLAKLLRLDGNEVQIAQDGIEALDAAEKFRPDVAVLDIAMPKLNGYDAARMIREQPWGKSMVLIALTGWGQQQDRRLTKEAGFDAHLTKPIKYESLLEVLTHVSVDALPEVGRSQEL